MGDVDIDLYGDVEQDFSQEDFGDGDLYDAVLTGGNDRGRINNDLPPDGPNGIPGRSSVKSRSSSVGSEDRISYPSSLQQPKYQLYVGNLNWWTTDEDVMQALIGIGINDVIEIKFHENRANGQSKGFCSLGLGSETSSRIIMDKLSRKEIQGMNPMVTYFTKQALIQFESKSKTRASPQGQQQQQRGMGNNQGGPRMPPPRMPHMSNMDHRPMPPGIHGPPHGQHLGPPMPVHGSQGPRLPQHSMGNMHPTFDMARPMHPPPANVPMRGPPPPMAPTMNVPPPRPPPPVDNRHQQIRPDFLQIPPPIHGGVPQPAVGPPPAPHVNPAFFPPHSGPPPNPAAAAPPPHFPPPGHAQATPHSSFVDAIHRLDAPPPISEAEFEDIMNRNRTVSSSAIARAVADASSGEYAGAIETLVTAISLIKQSKVAHDERCKILISSLQDTLHGIEAKSYGTKRRERSRTPTRRHRRERSRSRGYRSRSHSREREYERPRERERERREIRDYAERSYSSERDYEKEREKERDREREREREREKERERERERYYEDRYRERERRERLEERVPARERLEERSSRGEDGGSGREREREREREIRPPRDDRETTSHSRSRH